MCAGGLETARNCARWPKATIQKYVTYVVTVSQEVGVLSWDGSRKSGQPSLGVNSDHVGQVMLVKVKSRVRVYTQKSGLKSGPER